MIIARSLITIIWTCYQVIPKKSMSLVDIAECLYHLAKFLRRRRSQSIGGCKATDIEIQYVFLWWYYNWKNAMEDNMTDLGKANLSTTIYLKGLMSVIVHSHWRNYTPLPQSAHLLMGSMVSLMVLFAGVANLWVIGLFIR